MNNKPDRNPLWNALVEDAADPEVRERMFRQTMTVARGRRRRRVGMLVAGFLLPLASFLFFLTSKEPLSVKQTTVLPQTESRVASVDPPPKLAPKPDIISDEELFAMFPDHALALVGKPGEQQLVILGKRD
ncbi:MAG: hypothetical protein ACPGVU_23410 [Limisphaerales bacterium]